MKTIAIIPARSGSKRIRNKNICQFGGKPMMAWCLEQALKSGLFDRVYVSTDSERYAEIARSYGAWVPFLRDACADDLSGIAQVVVHELSRIEALTDEHFDVVASIQPTCPLIRAKTMHVVYNAFVSQEAETMVSCFPFAYGNPWWSMSLRDDATADFVLSSPSRSRSQDKPQLYCPTGAVSFARTSSFREDPTYYGSGSGHKFCPIPWEEGFDIDVPEDLLMGEFLLARRSREQLEGRTT